MTIRSATADYNDRSSDQQGKIIQFRKRQGERSKSLMDAIEIEKRNALVISFFAKRSGGQTLSTDEETEAAKRLLVRLQRYAQYKRNMGHGVIWKSPKDYVQEAVTKFIPIVRKDDVETNGESFDAYLRKAIYNQMVDDSKKKSGHEMFIDTEQMTTYASKDGSRGSVTHIENTIFLKHIKECLPEKYESIYPLLVEWYDGSSLRDLAKEYKMNKDSVRKKIRELQIYIQSEFLLYNEYPP